MGVTRPSADAVQLEGRLERITYTREDTGYTVAQVHADGHSEPVTVVGTLTAPSVGEHLRMTGVWVTHPRYGRQFQVHTSAARPPTTPEGIEKYLSAGLIPGLGPVTARRIVNHFGTRTLEVIDADPEQLLAVPGIGSKRIAGIAAAWQRLRGVRDVLMLLRSYDISTTYALRIVKRYGERAAAVIRNDPYRLAADIRGIGFRKADAIAAGTGIAADAPVRVGAGLFFVLEAAADDGHVCLPRDILVDKASELLGVDAARVTTALDAAVRGAQLVLAPPISPEGAETVFLARFHFCETSVARHLRTLVGTPPGVTVTAPQRAIHWAAGRLRFDLSEGQTRAVAMALAHAVTVITGGPGTGKTTIIRAVVEIYRRAGASVALAAPTGRAAKRLSEATGQSASTIHRLLEYSPRSGGFQRNARNPLPADVLIVDEASMLDTVIMHFLMVAVPPGCVLVLVGDVHQLPSVGPGNVLGDIIDSDRVPVSRLTDIYRQARQSRIVVNAHRIHSGKMPVTDAAEALSDFYFIEQDDPEAVLETILRLVSDRIPRRFEMDAVDDIQVITPMHKGLVGTVHLNHALQRVLNPRTDGILRGEGRLTIGDKVMQVRNNYDKEVFNGDMGRIETADEAARQIRVRYDGRLVDVEDSDLDDVTLAYAVSVHKAQGSEYPAVVLPVMTQHYVMLQRNLLYTAVTRGRRLVVVVGSRRALRVGIGRAVSDRRFTMLREWLQRP